jgi:hypothetical protein
MPAPGTRSHVGPVRRPPAVALVLLLLILPATAVLLGGAAVQGLPVGVVQDAGSDAPAPQTTTDYDNRVGGPHQDTPEEQTGRAVSPARLALILAVVVVTVGIVTTIAVRSRRRRRAGEPDLS